MSTTFILRVIVAGNAGAVAWIEGSTETVSSAGRSRPAPLSAATVKVKAHVRLPACNKAAWQ